MLPVLGRASHFRGEIQVCNSLHGFHGYIIVSISVPDQDGEQWQMSLK